MSIRDVLDPEMSRPWQENTLNFEFESPTISLPECKERKQNSLNHFFQNQNRSLFVRDLPFHTTAEVLREFIEKKLNHPDCVEDVLIRFSQQGKTLQVGCVLLRSESIIADALEKLHGCRFCGRDLRVTVYNNKAPIEDSQNAAVQFSFLANDAQIPLVTEEVVRSHMEELYGSLRDVCIRFHRYSEIGIQSGYGFLSFINDSDNDRAVEQVQKKVVHNLQYDCRWSSKCKPVSAPGTLRNKRLIHLASATPTYGPESLSTISHIPETTVAASLEFSHIESLSKMELAASLTRNHPLHPSPVHRSNAVPNSASSLLSKDPLRHGPEENIRHVNLSAPPNSNYLSYEQSRHPPPPPRDYSLARDEFFHRHYHRDDPSFVNSNLEHRYSAAHYHYDPPRPHDFQHHNVDQDRYFYQTPGGIYDRHLPAGGYPPLYDKYERERYLLDRYVPERHPSERFPERYALDRPLNERYPADPRTAFSCYRDMHPHHPQYAPGRGEDGQFQSRSSTGSHSMYRDNPQDIEVIVPDDRYFMGASARDNRRSVHDNADPRRGLEGRLMENMYRPMQHLPLPSHGSTRGPGPASSALSSLPSRFGPRSSIYEPHDHRDMVFGAGSANVGPLRNTAPSRPFVSAASHAQARPSQMHPTQLLPARQLTDEMSMNTSTASLSASSQPSFSNRSMASSDAMANMFSYSFGRKNEDDGLPAPASSSSLSHSSSFTFDETAHASYLLSQFRAPSASEALPVQSILDTNVGESMVTSLVTAESEDLNTSASVDNSVLAVLLKDVPSSSQLSMNTPGKESDKQ